MRESLGLLERDETVEAVELLLSDAASGRSRALFVLGEAGLGKTSLIDLAMAQATRAGLPCGLARGHPMETGLPFGLAMQALDAVGGCDLLGSEHLRSDSVSDRAATFFRVLRWLQDRGSQLLLALDDVHWADADSLSLLSFLCRRLGSLQLSLVATMRPWPSEARDAAAELAHEGSGTLRELAPLTEPAAEVLLRARLGRGLPDAQQRRAYSLCAGNPLLLEQLAVALAHGEELPELTGPGRPPFGQGMLLARFAGLPAAGMRCAQAAAVLGNSFLPAVAAEVAGLDGGEVDAALDALGRSGLIKQVPGASADFLHPLFRQALYDDLAGGVRARLHGRAFAALHARGLEAQAAEHVVPAQLAGDPEAVAVLERVGHAARRAGALAAAVAHLDAAVAMAGGRASIGLRLAQGESLLVSGHLDRALAAYEQLLGRPDCTGPDRVQALWMLGRARVMTGEHEWAAALFDEAAEVARSVDPAMAVAVLLDAAFSAEITRGPKMALSPAVRARELARSLDAPIRVKADAGWGEVAIQAGDPAGITAIESAAPWLSTGWTLSPEIDSNAWGSVSNFAFSCALTERLAEADRAFVTTRASAERASAPEAMAVLATGHGYALMRMGRLPEALEAINVALSLVDLAPVLESFAAVGSAYIRLFMGRLEESASWFERVEAVATARSERNALLFLWDGRGHRLLREGAVGQACEIYGRLEQTIEEMGIGEPCLPAWGRHAIAAYLAAGRREDAERVLTWLDQTRMPCRYPRIAASTGRAQLAELDGDESAAQAHYHAALGLHEEVDLPLEHAETLLAYGGFLRRSGQVATARSVLVQAAAVAEASGAGWLAGFAHDELKVAGGRQRQRSSRQLTAQEERVARLAATGAANAEVARQLYLSVSTVETHLEHVYAKLGIHSRYELIARVGELDPGAKS
jgi:DNA-binding CsgD family transcriptional regulator